MNKYLIILGFVGTALFSACSSDDLMTGISPEEERALVVEAGKDSDIPITFGSIGDSRIVMTRTPIELDENDLFVTPNGEYLGVFCLATGKQEDAPSFIGDVVWNDPNKIANWKENVPAKVTINGTTNEVTFLDPNALPTETPKEWFYPFGNWYHYNFYAYYPRITDDEAIHVGSNSIVVDYEIDGKQDIIWGKTTPPETEAYSALYFRVNGVSAAKPEYAFDHKLAQLVFKVKPTAGSITIEAIKLKDVCYKLSLVVAGSSAGHTQGTLFVNALSATKDIQVWNSDDQNPFDTDGDEVITPINISSETKIGYMLVPPSSESYSVSVKLDGIDEPKIVDIGPVEAGHKYTFTLEI